MKGKTGDGDRGGNHPGTLVLASSWNFNPHFAVFHLRLKPWLYHGAAKLMLTSAHIELPAVPRAGDDAALQIAFAERSALMRTDAVEREVFPVDVVQRDDPIPRDGLTTGAGRNLADFADGVPGHA